MDAQSLKILLVEDNPADVVMIQEGFKQSKLMPQFVVANDGEAAISYLDGSGSHSPSKPPNFIFLDLDLPKIDGYGVLGHIAADPELHSIVIIVISGHVLTESRLGSYRWQVAHFFGKPFGRAGYVEIVEAVEAIWNGQTQACE